MTCHETQLTRSPTVTITRSEFFGLCEAQLVLSSCRQNLEGLATSRNNRIRSAALNALEQLTQVQKKLRATTGG